MDDILPALWGEFQKVRHSKVLWITGLAFSLVTLISGLFMFILKDPEQARRLGLLGAKAQIFGGSATWANYFNLAVLLMSIGGLIIIGFIFVWIFGREFGDKTIYDILSLPTSRSSIVTAKIIVATCWSVSLIVMVFGLMLGLGLILQLSGGSLAVILHGMWLLTVTGLLTILLCIPFAMVASITRGYLPSVGGIFLILILGQIVSQLGYGQYFPWTIPMIYSGAAEALTGKTAVPLGIISYILVGFTGLISLLVTDIWWRYADQT